MKRDSLGERVILIPIMVFNSESLGDMGLRVWDWKYLAVQTIRKLDALALAITRTKNNPFLELPEKPRDIKITESTLDQCPYATPKGVIVDLKYAS